MKPKLHSCEGRAPSDGYGEAIDLCVEIEDQPGKFWVGNSEYGSQVAYCPFCGEKAPVAPVYEE
jgi:hypothetical protein